MPKRTEPNTDRSPRTDKQPNQKERRGVIQEYIRSLREYLERLRRKAHCSARIAIQIDEVDKLDVICIVGTLAFLIVDRPAGLAAVSRIYTVVRPLSSGPPIL